MFYNNTEVDAAPQAQSEDMKPTWVETVEAAYTNFRSVNLSTSEMNYYIDEIGAEIDALYEQSPDIDGTLNGLKGMSPANLKQIELLHQGGFDITKRRGGQAYLNYMALVKDGKAKPFQSILESSHEKAKTDYIETAKTLQKSDSITATMVGSMGGAMTDPMVLMTLPIGIEVGAGRTIASAAGRSALQAATLETGVQAVVAPQVYAFKRELDIKTSIEDEAVNALTSIAAAGALTGMFTAGFEVTKKGLGKLKEADPELAADYESLTKGKITESTNEHIENLHKAEFTDEQLTLRNPTDDGIEISSREPVKEFDAEVPELEPIEIDDIKMHYGVDENGEDIYRSLNDIKKEIDVEEAEYNEILACLKGGA